MGGAERLLGRGDMLYLPADAGRPERIQCCFLADEGGRATRGILATTGAGTQHAK